MAESASFKQKSFLGILLTIFIGLLVAAFVGLGISAFYPSPKPPLIMAYPQPFLKPLLNNILQKDPYALAQIHYQQSLDRYQKLNAEYNRNVSLISLIGAIFILIISLFFLQDIQLIGDGLLLGSIFILLYSISRSINSNNNLFQFLLVSIELVISIFISYNKFIKPQSHK